MIVWNESLRVLDRRRIKQIYVSGINVVFAVAAVAAGRFHGGQPSLEEFSLYFRYGSNDHHTGKPKEVVYKADTVKLGRIKR